MNVEPKMELLLDQYLDCFGRYRGSDPVCREKCAVSLRCSIERDQSERFEILEELVSAGDMPAFVN
jgi:hypothetical protein